MEDLIGFIVFLAIALISAMGKAEGRSKGKRAQRPRTYQPPVPRHTPAPAPRTGRSPLPPTAPEYSSREGGTQPEASSVRTEPQSQRREAQVAAGRQQLGAAIRAEREQFAKRTSALTSLGRHESEGAQATAPESHPLAAALASRDGLAQAVLMAEVLGKPKALRRGK